MSSITLRPPTFSKAKPPSEYRNPTISWLTEEWHVTHSTLPMWKSKRNVRIKYTPLDPSDPSIEKGNTDRFDDYVTYQGLKGDKISEVKGVSSAGGGEGRGEWNWRGRGWLMIASSHWEILAWGEELETQNKYVVTMFAKTLFTPAGLDVYSKDRAGVKSETLEEIKKALAEVHDQDVKKLAGEIFEVTRDDDRKD